MGKRLIVYVPGLGLTSEGWNPLVSKLKADPALGGATWMPWDHHVSWWSLASPHSLARALADAVHERWIIDGPYDHVTLVGHSMGGLLVRQALLLGRGDYEKSEAPFPRQDWAAKVGRVVMLAGLNRGLDPKKLYIRVGDALAQLTRPLRFGRMTLAQHLMRGATYITDLRIRWMRSMSDGSAPTVVQVVGNDDGLVTREDSIDLDQFPNAFHLTVSDAPHRLIHRLDVAPDPDARAAILRAALAESAFGSADSRDGLNTAEHVFFVLHGIRAANRGWVNDVESLVNESGLRRAEVVTPSYGYLSALEFALPFLHRRPILRFQNLYADQLARNPNAEFYFLGHSNGTYILGQSLRELGGMCFKHIALAGSVLPRDYPWHRLHQGRQFAALRNDQASGDVPVGFLCSGLRGLGRRDIGTGGFEGFNDDDSAIRQLAFHEGGHGSALDRENLGSMVAFLVHGLETPLPAPDTRTTGRLGLLSRVAPWLFPLLLALVVALLVRGFWIGSVSLWAGTLAGLAVLALILKVL